MIRALLLLAAIGACSARDIVASAGGGSSDIPSYCTGTGPPILVGDGITVGESDGSGENICTGTIAVRTFVRALCTCDAYVASTPLVTDSYDSAAGPYMPGGTTGDVGIDDLVQASAQLQIGGAFVVAGAAGAALLADLHVARDLAIGGHLGSGVAVTAGGDAQIAGNIDLASLSVAGTLTVPSTATIAGTVTASSTVRAPVTVAPPCACGDADLVDIPAFVSSHATDNQDALIGLTPDRLTGYHGDATLDLPCGIYYLGPVHGDGSLTLRITGRVALLVAGDFALSAPFTVELATDDAELDLMVSGLLSSNQAMTIGRADHPSRTRVYIGGTGTIDLSGDSSIAANIYAPRAAIALSGTTTIFGSLFVRRLDQAAPVTIHYDVDIRRADVACPIM